MRVSRAVLLSVAGLLALCAALVVVPSAAATVTNTSRLDMGLPVEVRQNEAFYVGAAEIYYNSSPQIEAVDWWWDLDSARDTDPVVDGIPNNDVDNRNLTFQHPGLPDLGVITFTMWVNFTDGVLVNGSLEVTVVANEPPAITTGTAPSGYVDEPVYFTVTVSDPDSLESTLVYEWDFNIAFDSDQNGIPDDDVDSTNKTNVSYTYRAEQTYTAQITVRDDFGAEAKAFINVVVQRPPGISGREVEVVQYHTENITIRAMGWASYHMKVTAGRLYSYDVQASNGVPVFVMVQVGKQQYDQYRFRTSLTAYTAEFSTVVAPSASIHKEFRPTVDGDLWVTVDNGFLFGIDPQGPGVVTVTVQDLDRNNLLANIPSYVWIIAIAAGIGVAGVFGGKAYMAGAEARKLERERRAVDQQEKSAAKSELDQLLQDPTRALQRRMAPPPPPPPPPPQAPFYGPPPAAVAAGPARAGPAPPPGYVPRPAPAPAPRVGPPGPGGPQPPRGYAPAPATATQAPPPAYAPYPPQAPAGPQPPRAAPGACGNCGQPTEVGWQVCPNCGANL